MSWLSYLAPRIAYRTSTKYNRDVRVVEERGKYKLLVNGSRQSGEYIRKLWQHAFAQFRIFPSPDVRKILVLGVGGGTVLLLLRAMYPDAAITAVDIDEAMIAIAKKYFGVTGCTLLVADAREFVKTKGTWDMIVIDLFIGATIPTFVSSETFLQNVSARESSRGVVLVNYLQEFEYGKLSDIFFKKLTKIFGSVRDARVNNNRFFCVIK